MDLGHVLLLNQFLRIVILKQNYILCSRWQRNPALQTFTVHFLRTSDTMEGSFENIARKEAWYSRDTLRTSRWKAEIRSDTWNWNTRRRMVLCEAEYAGFVLFNDERSTIYVIECRREEAYFKTEIFGMQIMTQWPSVWWRKGLNLNTKHMDVGIERQGVLSIPSSYSEGSRFKLSPKHRLSWLSLFVTSSWSSA